jgi:glycosyltransferase involved in cell wall biosynthesis
MNPRLLSVIIPARNEHRLIGSTLDCVLNAVRNIGPTASEVIVVDNDSIDGTWEILQRYAADHGIAVLRLDQLGAARARNHGRRHATGRILVFIDADTHVSFDCLQRIVAHCEKGGIEAGITRLAGLDGGLRARLWWFFWEHVRRLPLPRAKAMPALMFCTAAVFDEFGPFDEEVAIGEEWPILASLYRHRPHRFVYDRSISALSSSRRMQSQPFGYARTFLKYIWAILHRSGRLNYSDRVR